MEYVKKYNEIKKEYKKKFGKDSLDYYMEPDILHDGKVGFEDAITELENAIKNNKPIEPINTHFMR